jgi:hypothetical protein
MKYLSFLFTLLCLNCYSQDSEQLKQQDTIYLVLPQAGSNGIIESKERTFSDFKLGISGNGTLNQYLIREISGDGRITLNTQDDTSTYFMKNNLTVNRKLFLSKHKNAVITLDFINNHGFRKVFYDMLDVYNRGKHKFYVINEDDLTGDQLILKATNPLALP